MSFVLTENSGNVLVLTINRPEALNALNRQVLNDLKTAMESIDREAVRCVIITGAGEKSFVAGADIAEMASMNEAEGRSFSRFGNDCFRLIEAFPIPVIAAVNGYALGGGNELAMACDIRLCSENALFGQPEVGLGITPGFGGTQRLARVIGSLSKAKEMLFTGKPIKAEEALRIGLVSAVYPQSQLMEESLKMANTISQNAPIALRRTKQALDEGISMAIDKALDLEADQFGACFASLDQKEGMSAFLEKRKNKHFVNK